MLSPRPSRRKDLWLVVLSATLGTVVGSTGAAAQGDHGGVDAGAGIHDGRPTAIVVSDAGGQVGSWEAAAGGGGSGSSWDCYYHDVVMAGGSSNSGFTIDHSSLAALEEGAVAALVCRDGDGVTVHAEIVVWEGGDPLGAVAATDRALDAAVASLDLPDPSVMTSPPPDASHFVGLATWIWDERPLAQHTATASAAGVSATVVATPGSLRWIPGDRSDPVTCPGSGVPYGPGADEDLRCAHIWQHRSTHTDPAGRFGGSVTLVWEVTWEASDGEGGELGEVTTESDLSVLVREAQAVVHH